MQNSVEVQNVAARNKAGRAGADAIHSTAITGKCILKEAEIAIPDL
jgi:hypothetical protein